MQAIDNVNQFEALFNYATIGIVVTNDKAEIVNFNSFAEEQFGYTKTEVLGQKIEILLPASLKNNHIHYRNQYYVHPVPRVMGHGRDLHACNKAGINFPVEVSLCHYHFNNETYVIAFVIDITVRKNQENLLIGQRQELERVTKEIKQMNAHLEKQVDDRTKMLREALSELEKSKEELSEAYEIEKELSELKSRFVTMASHEFRTPLSTILSSAYLLEKYNQQSPDPKIEKHLYRIKSAVGGMKSILEDFLSLGKLEEGLVQTQIESLSPEQFDGKINELVQEMELVAKDEQKILLTNTVHVPVAIDVHLVRNILINLLSNAVKFARDNSTITLTCSLNNKNLVIAVADNGIGISEEDQQHLFERFFRAKNSSNIQGTGLGLHIVGKYLELLNGNIELNSKIDEGSTFTFYLPQ